MKNLNFLHICHDDKFIDFFISDFDSKFANNTYFIYREKGIKSLTHIKYDKVISEEKESENFNNIFKSINNYDAIFLHYITPMICLKLNENLKNKKIKIFVMFWGGEIFDLPGVIEDYLGNESKLINKKLCPKKKLNFAFKPRNLILEIKHFYKDKFVLKEIRKTYKRANYFCHFLNEDFKQISKLFPNKAKFIDFNYGNVESFVGGNIDPSFNHNSSDILIGNSGSITNNHIEIFNILNEIEIGKRKLFTPLSYSIYPSAKYLELVLEKGEKLFDENFKPILNFLEKDEYNKIYNSVEYVFMNHFRSQAMGNIYIALYTGKKLFMSKKSTIFQQLNNYGCLLFAIEDIPKNKIDVFKKLSIEEKKRNRSIILKYFGKKKINEKYTKLCNELKKKQVI